MAASIRSTHQSLSAASRLKRSANDVQRNAGNAFVIPDLADASSGIRRSFAALVAAT
jgi:hypothetical protein